MNLVETKFLFSFDGNFPFYEELIENPWDEYRTLNQYNRGSSFNLESYIVSSITKKMLGVHLVLPPHLKIEK
jgi:hypothetical protein